MIAGPFTYGAGLDILYSFQKKSQRFKIACLEEFGCKRWMNYERKVDEDCCFIRKYALWKLCEDDS
jgi:hypothetical protein